MLRESPDEARYQFALANTLLNMAGFLSPRDQADELESLYHRVVELDRSAIRTVPDDPGFNAESASALGDQGMFFLETGRRSEAEAAVREAVQVHQRVLAGQQLKGSVERYAVRNFDNLGRVLVTAGQAAGGGKQCFREAVKSAGSIGDGLARVGVPPDGPVRRMLPHLAELLKDLGRWSEAEETCRRVIHIYETLKAKFAEDRNTRNLVGSYMQLARLLCKIGRETKAAEPYRKALELEEDDPPLTMI